MLLRMLWLQKVRFFVGLKYLRVRDCHKKSNLLKQGLTFEKIIDLKICECVEAIKINPFLEKKCVSIN